MDKKNKSLKSKAAVTALAVTSLLIGMFGSSFTGSRNIVQAASAGGKTTPTPKPGPTTSPTPQESPTPLGTPHPEPTPKPTVQQ